MANHGQLPLAIAIRATEVGVSLLPEICLEWLARGLGRLVWTAWPFRKEIVRTNLQAAFPEWSADEVERHCKKTYQHLCYLALITFRLRRISFEGVSRVHFDIPHEFREDLAGKKGIILCTGHYGLWEMLPLLRVILWSRVASSEPSQHTGAKELAAVYRPLHIPAFNAWMLKQRSLGGATMISDKNPDCIDMLRSTLSNGGIVGLVADQEARYSHIDVCFMGRPSRMFTGMQSLHEEFPDVPVWFAAVTHRWGSVKPFHLQVRLIHRDTTTGRRNDCGQFGDTNNRFNHGSLVQAYADILSVVVKEHPEQYLWHHRLWRLGPTALTYRRRSSEKG